LPNFKCQALYDTGAGPNCMSDTVYRIALQNGQVLSQINSTLKSIRTAGGQSVKILGVFLIRVIFHGRSYVGPFTVVTGLSSPIIIGMVGAKDMALDYSVTDNKFTFRKELSQNQEMSVTVKNRKELRSRETGRVRCVIQEKGLPVRNKTVIAAICGTDVIVSTDSQGECSIVFSNPGNDTITYRRAQDLGPAEIADDLDFDLPVTRNNVATVAALTGVAHPKGDAHNRAPPKVAEALRPQFEAATKHLAPDVRQTIMQTLWKHWRASSTSKFDLGLSKVWEHRIRLTERTPAYRKQFPIPLEHVPIIREHVDRWLELGIVEPARSPYNSPLFCVKKKGGGFRLCLDYRLLNSRSHPENYSIRTPEDCMAEIGQNNSRYFIALDLTSGFYQMSLAKESRPYTAFTVAPYGQLQWTRSAMGLKGCPGSFARLMDITLRGIPNTLVYIDDVLIHGKTQMEAIAVLDKVLQRLAEHNLKVNIPKSSFFASKTEYLGHTLSASGITPGSNKSEAIINAQPPTTIKGVKSFLGMVNYFRSFIKHFAQKAGVLYNLTKVNSQWKQGPLPPQALKNFNILKTAIAKVVPRSFPFPTGKYHLFTDGSLGDDKQEGGLGGHLMQEGPDGSLHTIAFASRALRPHEKNYSAFLLELQAAVNMIDHFDHYLRGRSFTLYTDHAPMTALSKIHTKTLHRLHSLLNEYSFDIKHIPGKQNPVADFLSRSHGPARSDHCVEAIAAISNETCLKQAQQDDEVLGPILKALRNKQVPNWPQQWKRYAKFFIVHQGYLCVKLPARQGFMEDNMLRAVPPKHIQLALLQEAHNSALGGHQGIFRTMERIRLAFWWPSMLEDVKQHVSHCNICQATSNKAAAHVPQHHELPQCTRPNERVHADLFGPIIDQDKSSKFILGLTDAFTKMIRLVAIPNKEARTVAMAIWRDWMTIYGIPTTIFTDQGKEFTSKLQHNIFQVLRVKHNTTSPYWPKCNMMQERQNKELAKYLRAILFAANKSSTDWECYLPALMLSLNTAYNRATKQAPFFTMFGYDAQIPLWENAEILKRKQFELPPQDADCFYKWQETRRIARHVAHDNEKIFRASYPPQDPAITQRAYSVGQKVFIRVQQISATNKKFGVKWDPAVIVSRVGPSTYKVRRENVKFKRLVTSNEAHLKPREPQPDYVEPWPADEEEEETADEPQLDGEGLEEHDEDDPLYSDEDPAFHGWPSPPVQVPREVASEPLLSALKFTKGGKTYDLEEWIHRFDVTEEELREAIRRVMSYKGKAKYSILANHFGVAIPPPDPLELNEPFVPPPPAPPAGHAPPPAPPMPVPPSPMSWRDHRSPPSSGSSSPPSPSARELPPSPMWEETQQHPGRSPPQQQQPMRVSPPREQQQQQPMVSPPRGQYQQQPMVSPPRGLQQQQPMVSPPREQQQQQPRVSPPRGQYQQQMMVSPPREQQQQQPMVSPPRGQYQQQPMVSPPREPQQQQPMVSPPRAQQQQPIAARRVPISPAKLILPHRPQPSPWHNLDAPQTPMPSPVRTAVPAPTAATGAIPKRQQQLPPRAATPPVQQQQPFSPPPPLPPKQRKRAASLPQDHGASPSKSQRPRPPPAPPAPRPLPRPRFQTPPSAAATPQQQQAVPAQEQQLAQPAGYSGATSPNREPSPPRFMAGRTPTQKGPPARSGKAQQQQRAQQQHQGERTPPAQPPTARTRTVDPQVRKRLQMEEDSPPPPIPPKQRQQQQSPSQPTTAAAVRPLPQGTQLLSPPWVVRKTFNQAPQSNLEFDHQCHKAKQYQEARSRARQLYLDHAANSCPSNSDPVTWRAHHVGLFDAMNPHPSGLFDRNIMPDRRDYPATPEEVLYLRNINQFRLDAQPTKVKTVKDVNKDAKQRYKK
jgi:hypothetical protein